MKENTMATNFKPQECVIFVQSTKIGTQENKAIHSTFYVPIEETFGLNIMVLLLEGLDLSACLSTKSWHNIIVGILIFTDLQKLYINVKMIIS